MAAVNFPLSLRESPERRLSRVDPPASEIFFDELLYVLLLGDTLLSANNRRMSANVSVEDQACPMGPRYRHRWN